MPASLIPRAARAAIVGLALGGCAPAEPPPVHAPATPGFFSCGELECRIDAEYCRREFPGAVAPGTPGYSERCAPLPHPDCEEIERSGKCLGTPDTGMTIEIYFP